jgi:hypothetical protein
MKKEPYTTPVLKVSICSPTRMLAASSRRIKVEDGDISDEGDLL